MQRLRDRHAVLTGASRGVGKHLAFALAREGINLTLAARSATDLEAVRSDVEAVGVRAIAVPTDVADAGARANLLQRAEAELGPIDILINNAGVEWACAYPGQDPAEITQTIDINLTAPMLLTRAALPAMIRRGEGHVVNIASAAGKSGTPYEVAYSASKFGLVGFTNALRVELGSSGVGCSVICPGFISGDGMYARLEQEGLRSNRLLGVSPMEDVTRAVVDAIKRNRAEVVVNPTPLRAILALEVMAPGMHPFIMRVMGVTRLFGKAAEMRAGG